MFNYLKKISVSVITLLMMSASYAAPAPDFTKAIRLARGPLLSGKGDVAALFKNADGVTARLEIWGWKNGSFEKLATAPKAGCFDCAGIALRNEWMPSSLAIQNGELWADYHGGSGQEKWSWHTQWVWDFILGSPRARAVQRLGSNEQNKQRLLVADFIAGEQLQKVSMPISELKCRLPSFSAPEFEDLSLKALFQGQFEPGCISGTEKGNPLAGVPHIQAAFAEDLLGQKRKKSDALK